MIVHYLSPLIFEAGLRLKGHVPLYRQARSGRGVETAESELRDALPETNKKTRERELPGLLFRCRLINQLTRQVSPLDNSFFRSPGPVLAFASSSCLLIAPS